MTVDDGEGRERNGVTRSVAFERADVDASANTTVTATAVDARGQTATATRTLGSREAPRLLSAEFVNGPVDSYHERIDAGRYTAHHVTKVDLNGTDPETVKVRQIPGSPDDVLRVSQKKRVVDGNTLTVHTYWAAYKPGDNPHYTITTRLDVERAASASRVVNDDFEVEPSKPELRLRMLNDGTDGVDMTERIEIDASGSFDPDGSDLTYTWKMGANPHPDDNSTAYLSYWDAGKLVLEDEQDQVTTQTWSALRGFVPEIDDSKTDVWPVYHETGTTPTMYPISSQPYSSAQTLRVRVRTEPIHFRRETSSVSVGAELDGSAGEIVRWNEVPYTPIETRPGDAVGGRNSVYYEGVIELEAAALASEDLRPTLTLYNEEQPDFAREQYDLPTVRVQSLNETRHEDLEVSDVSYAIERPVTERMTVEDRERLQRLRSYGFTVVSASSRVTGYEMERREKVRDAEYETSKRLFDRRWQRRLFIDENDGWGVSGTETTRHREPRTETEWRSARGEDYTGETRRVLVSPARYLTERQYRYWTTETYEREVESRQCLWGGHCYTVTRTEERTRRVSKTYWSLSARSSSHSPTGRTRQHKIRSAEYETQYEHRYTTWETVTERRYEATKRELVSPAVYEWRDYRTVADSQTAWRLAKADDIRIGAERRKPTWEVLREGTKTVERPAYEDAGNVTSTHATVTGTTVRYTTQDGEVRRRVVGPFETEFSGAGVVNEESILREVREEED
ncbi:hypothetical protein [Halomarina ordinaria]|uniref:Uncharacterized protein n=1 Tax=Halomarina ordinaria TaxID=3033939 RepID=A0ABD5UAD8_9EURY|nr:hypothetical protein [Halomarina sp. PSRA2]